MASEKKDLNDEKKAGVKQRKELVVRGGGELSIPEMMSIVKELYASRYFTDLQSLSQAIAKAQAGRELGFPPFYSLNHLYMVPGRPPGTDGQAMASLIRNNGYNFKEVKLDDDECIIDFFGKKGEKLGTASFTYEEARKIRIKEGKVLADKSNWRNYRQDMLWWRTISRGGRRHCPDALAGVYYFEELDIEVDNQGKVIQGDVIEAEAVEEGSPAGKTTTDAQVDTTPTETHKKERKEQLSVIKEELGKKIFDDLLENEGKKGIKEMSKKLKSKDDDDLKGKLAVEFMKKIKSALKIKDKIIDTKEADYQNYIQKVSEGMKD